MFDLFKRKKKASPAEPPTDGRPDAVQAASDRAEAAETPPSVPEAREQPPLLAAGLIDRQYSKGQWTLDREGVLRYDGHDLLFSGEGASALRSKVRKIVIDGFWYVGPEAFASFPNCEEVVFHWAHVQLDAAAFAHCEKLRSVIFADSHEAAPDAFRDTPYQAALEGIEYVPEARRDRAIAYGPWGAKFIESLHEELALIRTTKSPTGWAPDGWSLDDRDWFMASLALIDKGAAAGEAPLLYLAGEYRRFGYWDYQNCFDEPLSIERRSAEELYIESAEKGFPAAMLWCAYCYAGGRHGFPADPGRAARLTEALASSGRMPRTLALAELRFLKDAADAIAEAAFDADREADIIGERFGFDPEKSRDSLPDPSWRALHLRNVALALFMVSLGLPYVLSPVGYEYHWPVEFGETAGRIRAEKTAWLEWCRARGIDISLT